MPTVSEHDGASLVRPRAAPYSWSVSAVNRRTTRRGVRIIGLPRDRLLTPRAGRVTQRSLKPS